MTPSLATLSRHLGTVVVTAVLVTVLALVSAVGQGGGVPTPTTRVAQTVGTYTPATGATFNRPVGPREEQRRIFSHLIDTIDSVPADGQIKFAVFSFTDRLTADALLRAHARGVDVQLVFDDHIVFPHQRRLRDALGTDRTASSYVVFCSRACRGRGGDMHDKIFLFSVAGQAEFVTMVGSNNMTSHNAQHQWSDLYTVADDPAMYFAYAGVFDQLTRRTPVAAPFYEMDVSGYRSTFFPHPAGTGVDPVLAELRKITCTGVPRGYGYRGRTVLRISMHAWFGERGLRLAQQVAALRRQGCHVLVVPGVSIGRGVRRELTAAGASIAVPRRDGIRTHQKVFTISGGYDGRKDAKVVFAGSHNWTERSLTCDDVLLRISNPAAWAQYTVNFKEIRRLG